MVLRALVIFLAFSAYGQELKTITPEQFVAENPSTERKAIVSFIINQFNGKSVNQTELDRLWNDKKAREELHLARFQIIDQKVYADSFNIANLYFLKLLDYFQAFVQKYKVKNIDFLIHVHDEVTANNFESSIPIFMMSKDLTSPYEKNSLLFPDVHILMNNWLGLFNTIDKANIESTWNQKISKIFWRGASTGGRGEQLYNITNFDKLVRLKLVMLSKLYPDLIDARINRYAEFSDDQDGDNLKQLLDLLFRQNNPKISEVDHLKYKYLISVDGNTCAWMRVPWIMASNSVLVKQETSKIEWFYAAIHPYVHYVPVNENLTNIFTQFEWMKMHDSELQKISTNASHFIKNELMPEHIDAHMAIILDKYADIQQDRQIRISLTPYKKFRSVPFFIKGLGERLKIQLRALVKSWF